MGYLVEIDDSQQHVVYPPRGMEFGPVQSKQTSPGISQEQKQPWHQEELPFAFDAADPQPASS